MVLGCSFLYGVQNYILYHPVSYLEIRDNLINNPENHIRDVTIVGKNTYHGLRYDVNKQAATIVYFGGNFQSSEAFFYNAKITGVWEALKDYNIIMVDYPEYGISEGKISEAAIYDMADQTMDYVFHDETYKDQPIYIMGLSLGTGIVSYVASRYDTDGLILLAPYNNGTALCNSYLPIFYGPFSLLVRNKLPSDAYAKNVEEKMLIFASKDDEVINYKLSKTLQDSFKSCKFVTLEGLKHEHILENQKVLQEIVKFIK